MRQRTLPDLEDILDGSIADALFNFNCHKVGVIESFDTAAQTATIQLVDKATKIYSDSEELISYPPLSQVPVFINKGQNGGVTIPIVKGDTCLVLFNDKDLDNWFTDGLIQKPNTTRTHDLSDGIAIVGIRNSINKITDYNNEETLINYLANKISIGNSKTAISRSEGAEINLDDKLELKNSAQSLKAIIDELITIITSLKTVDPVSGELPIDAATASSLSALSTKVGELMK